MDPRGPFLYLLSGCGVSILCTRAPSVLFWIRLILDRGGVPVCVRWLDRSTPL